MITDSKEIEFMGKKVPFIIITENDFSNEKVCAGDEIRCPLCNMWHVLKSGKAKPRGETELLFYKCGNDLYLAGINSRLIRLSNEPVMEVRKNVGTRRYKRTCSND